MSVTPTALGRRAEQTLERLGDSESLWFEGAWHRSATLAARARRAARGFAQLGVAPGDRVVVLMANCPEVGIAYAALWRAGAVPTPVLFLLTEDELRHVVKDSGAVAVVTTPEFLAKVRGAAPGLPLVLVGEPAVPAVPTDPAGPDASSLRPGGPFPGPEPVPWSVIEDGGELPLVDRVPADLAALLYTGGTTGRSKGVALSHAGLDAAGAAAAAAAPSHSQRLILPLPLAHAYGLMVTVAGLHVPEAGGSVLMRWFDAAAFVALAEQHRVQATSLVPSMLQLLLGQPLEDHDLSSLSRVGCGAAPLAREVALEFERRVPGATVREGYGCTEASALISTQPVDDRRLGSVGRPVQGVRVRVVDPGGLPVPAGTDGEICVRGAVVMQGYWNSPEATAAAVRDGWFHTGDVGHLDDEGWLYVVDRLKDLVIRGGFNVYPRDVEDVLLAHPQVASAAVVGRADPLLGEEVVAFVALRAGATVDADALLAFAKERIGAHKYPREVHLVDAVPLTSVGKLDRKALRARLRR